MSAERRFVWTAALLAVGLFWLASITDASLDGGLLLVVLGAVVVLPFSVVLAGWLSAVRRDTRGWR
jgi:hypothetical protein